MFSKIFPSSLRRYLVVFVTVVSLVTLMAPVVLADSYDSFVFETSYTDATPIGALIPEGVYNISLFIDAGDDSFEVSSVEPVNISYGDIGDGLYGFWEVIDFGGIVYGEFFGVSCSVVLFKFGNGAALNISEPETGERVACRVVFTLVPESSAFSQFMVYSTTTLTSVVSWFGTVIDAFLGADGAFSVLLPFVAIVLAVILVYGGIKLFRQFAPGF